MERKLSSENPPKQEWAAYYRWSAGRPPRELLLRVLDHINWEGGPKKEPLAIDLCFGAGNDTLELLRRGWRVLAIDGQKDAARILARRVPPRLRPSLTTLVAPMEGLELPPADLVYASFALPFCAPAAFLELWESIRGSLRPGGHFAGQLFGDRDEWQGRQPLSFHTRRQALGLARGLRVEMLRETVEEGRVHSGPKHWHYFELILEKPRGVRRPRRNERR